MNTAEHLAAVLAERTRFTFFESQPLAVGRQPKSASLEAAGFRRDRSFGAFFLINCRRAKTAPAPSANAEITGCVSAFHCRSVHFLLRYIDNRYRLLPHA